MNFEGVATLLGSIGGLLTIVLVPFIGYWINSKTKKFDYNLQKIKEEDSIKIEEEKRKLSNNYSLIYGYLWKLLFEINADRIFILQPHPLSEKQFISISLEVVQPNKDVVSHKNNFQMKKMSEWALFVGKISKDDWMIYKNIEDIKDVKLKAECCRRGIKTLVYKRIADENNMWTGTLCAEWTHESIEYLDQTKGKMLINSSLISDILPEYKP